jgi:hypothetical protein
MEGRSFLEVARRLVEQRSEADWRTAAGRAYYALLSEARVLLGRWGFAPARRDQVHAFVRLRFVFATDPDLKTIGMTLEDLGVLRNRADYRLDEPGPFKSAMAARQAIQDAFDAITTLDRIDDDPARQATAIAAIRSVRH